MYEIIVVVERYFTHSILSTYWRIFDSKETFKIFFVSPCVFWNGPQLAHRHLLIFSVFGNPIRIEFQIMSYLFGETRTAFYGTVLFILKQCIRLLWQCFFYITVYYILNSQHVHKWLKLCPLKTEECIFYNHKANATFNIELGNHNFFKTHSRNLGD